MKTEHSSDKKHTSSLPLQDDDDAASLAPGHTLTWQQQFEIIFKNTHENTQQLNGRKKNCRYRCRLEQLREEIDALKRRAPSNTRQQ